MLKFQNNDTTIIVTFEDFILTTYVIIDELYHCKLRSNGMPVPLLRNGYSIFNGTKYR